jgi:hypothetical protein
MLIKSDRYQSNGAILNHEGHEGFKNILYVLNFVLFVVQ